MARLQTGDNGNHQSRGGDTLRAQRKQAGQATTAKHSRSNVKRSDRIQRASDAQTDFKQRSSRMIGDIAHSLSSKPSKEYNPFKSGSKATYGGMAHQVADFGKAIPGAAFDLGKAAGSDLYHGGRGMQNLQFAWLTGHNPHTGDRVIELGDDSLFDTHLDGMGNDAKDAVIGGSYIAGPEAVLGKLATRFGYENPGVREIAQKLAGKASSGFNRVAKAYEGKMHVPDHGIQEVAQKLSGPSTVKVNTDPVDDYYDDMLADQVVEPWMRHPNVGYQGPRGMNGAYQSKNMKSHPDDYWDGLSFDDISYSKPHPSLEGRASGIGALPPTSGRVAGQRVGTDERYPWGSYWAVKGLAHANISPAVRKEMKALYESGKLTEEMVDRVINGQNLY